MKRPRAVALVACLLVTGLLAGRVAVADEPFRATSRHGFDDPDAWSKVFDHPGRAEWQKPAALVEALGLEPGQTVADVGAGTGYFSKYLSRAVGPEGTVFAVDVEPELIAHIRDRAEREETANVTPLLASRNDPRLPRGGVDLVLFVDTFHHVDDRLLYFRHLQHALRPGGRVAIVDWKKKPLPVGPPSGHKLARDEVVAEMKAAGYEPISAPDLLPYQYVLFFRPARP